MGKGICAGKTAEKRQNRKKTEKTQTGVLSEGFRKMDNEELRVKS